MWVSNSVICIMAVSLSPRILDEGTMAAGSLIHQSKIYSLYLLVHLNKTSPSYRATVTIHGCAFQKEISSTSCQLQIM